MKRIFFPLLAGATLTCAALVANAQAFKQHVSKEFALSKEASATALCIYNIDGPVKVEGYSGDKVVMEIDEVITADDDQTLEAGKNDFRLGFDQTADTISAYIAEPYDSRPHRDWRQNQNGYRKIEYRYHVDFIVKVPTGINLRMSTVNNGDIIINDVAGTLHVNNVNGSILIGNAKGITDANTVNGKVEVSYLSVPPGQSYYHTINGEIQVTYPAGLSADLQFKSLNGQFFTDFPNVEVLPGVITKTHETGTGGTIYKLNKNSDIRIGKGGNAFNFETLNGNIYIKKQS